MFVVVLFSTATHRNALHNTATHCNTGLFFIDCRRMSASESDMTHLEATHCNASQHTATHCNTGLFFIDCRPHVCSDLNNLHATHCNTLQYTAAQGYFGHRLSSHVRNWEWCGSLTRNTQQHTATHCNTHCDTHCNTLQHRAMSYRLSTACPQSCESLVQHAATRRNTPQHTATHHHTLQHTATHCNTLQYTATQG